MPNIKPCFFVWLQQLCWLCHHVYTVSVCFNFGPAAQMAHRLTKQINLSLFLHRPRFLYMLASECWPLQDPEPLMYGEVQSPRYPQPYLPNLLKQWDLSVPEGYQIRLTFTHLDIEPSAGCLYDALTVRSTFEHIHLTNSKPWIQHYCWNPNLENIDHRVVSPLKGQKQHLITEEKVDRGYSAAPDIPTVFWLSSSRHGPKLWYILELCILQPEKY